MSWRRAIRAVRERGSLRSLARWLLAATLVISPWLYGGTTAWSIEVIDGLLGLVVAFWIASLVLDRRWPQVPRALLIISAIILLQGWWMVINARAVYDTAFRSFVWSSPLVAFLPGSIDFAVSLAFMTRVTLLLGILLLVAETARRPVWLARFWYTIAIAGGLIALLGLVQKATHAQMIFWASAPFWQAKTFFSSFYYHANAGAYLNLVLPAVAGLMGWTIVKGAHPLVRGFSLATVLIVFVAVLSNTSRMSQLVGGLIALAVLLAMAKPALRMMGGLENRTRIIGLVVIVIALFAVAQAAHLDQPVARWREFSEHVVVDQRWAANRSALAAIADAGVFGFGPGTFRTMFPHYQMAAGNTPRGTWRFLHEDYLQTILEWGWIGALLLAALFFGGIAAAARNYFRAEGWSSRQRILLPCLVLALAGIALHAAVDFPLQIFAIQLLVATYVGVCWGSQSWRNGEARIKR